MTWRWDQGRLDYFQFEEIQRIARGLSFADGMKLPAANEPDGLRLALGQFSSRPFLPADYTVWRNYKRVFACQMLATDLARYITVTDVCKKLATGNLSPDEYFLHFANNFSYPSPVFEAYTTAGHLCYPICAVLKYLLCQFTHKASPQVSLLEIIDRVIGNEMTGLEPISQYKDLPTTGKSLSPSSAEYRQIRELVIFVSQFSFLKWDNPNLLLDVSSHDEANLIAQFISPRLQNRRPEPSLEILQIGVVDKIGQLPEFVLNDVSSAYDQEFVEGNKVVVTHLRVERSVKLRELYFAKVENPHTCKMCLLDSAYHYPWAKRLVEVHHLLPLSSPLGVGLNSTSLKDLVGLCPSCHRATHKFYSRWLKDQNKKDFDDKVQAYRVYELAKESYVQ